MPVELDQNRIDRLCRNPDYFGGKPDIDTVTVKRVPQSSIRVVVLQTGEAPIATDLTPRC